MKNYNYFQSYNIELVVLQNPHKGVIIREMVNLVNKTSLKLRAERDEKRAKNYTHTPIKQVDI